MRLVFHPDAENELHAAIDYYQVLEIMPFSLKIEHSLIFNNYDPKKYRNRSRIQHALFPFAAPSTGNFDEISQQGCGMDAAIW